MSALKITITCWHICRKNCYITDFGKFLENIKYQDFFATKGLTQTLLGQKWFKKKKPWTIWLWYSAGTRGKLCTSTAEEYCMGCADNVENRTCTNIVFNIIHVQCKYVYQHVHTICINNRNKNKSYFNF